MAKSMILTSLGRQKAFDADTNGIKINISHIAIGDGEYEPSTVLTELVSEKMRVPILSKELNEEAYQVTLNAKFDKNDESFYIKEYGIFLDDGTLFAVWSETPSVSPSFKNKDNVIIQPIALNLIDGVNPDVVNIIDQGVDFKLNFTEEFEAIDLRLESLDEYYTEVKENLLEIENNVQGKIDGMLSLSNTKNISVDYTVKDNDILAIDTRISSIELTVPSTITSFMYFDAYGTFDLNEVVVAPILASIMGKDLEEKMITNTKNASRSFKKIDNDWRIV